MQVLGCRFLENRVRVQPRRGGGERLQGGIRNQHKQTMRIDNFRRGRRTGPLHLGEDTDRLDAKLVQAGNRGLFQICIEQFVIASALEPVSSQLVIFLISHGGVLGGR